MRIALDNSYLIESGEPGTFVDYDNAGRLMTSWDIKKRLSLIPDVEKYRFVGSEKLDVSFDQLKPSST